MSERQTDYSLYTLRVVKDELATGGPKKGHSTKEWANAIISIIDFAIAKAEGKI